MGGTKIGSVANAGEEERVVFLCCALATGSVVRGCEVGWRRDGQWMEEGWM